MSKTIQAEMQRAAGSEQTKSPQRFGKRLDDDSIAARAYERWRQRGFPAGCAAEDWMEAERELAEEEAESAA